MQSVMLTVSLILPTMQHFQAEFDLNKVVYSCVIMQATSLEYETYYMALYEDK